MTFEVKRHKVPYKVLVVAKQNSFGLKMGKRIADMLRNNVNISYDLSTALKLHRPGTSIKNFKGDLVITVGGDGTFLRAAHHTNISILPVKIEGHGFLCTCTYKELTDNLRRLVRGDYMISNRTRLSCSRLKKTRFEKYMSKIRHKTYPPSLNEITFARKRPSKILNIDVTIDNTTLPFSGDGIIISTPSGSTAYNASAGGPIIDPDIDAVSLIPLYPFYSKIKPIVLPANKEILVTVRGESAIIVDGHGGDYFSDETSFIIQKAEPLKVVHLVKHNFYERFKNEFL